MSKLVVYGGAGGLGRALVQHFKLKGYVNKKKNVTVSQSCTHYYNYTIRP